MDQPNSLCNRPIPWNGADNLHAGPQTALPWWVTYLVSPLIMAFQASSLMRSVDTTRDPSQAHRTSAAPSTVILPDCPAIRQLVPQVYRMFDVDVLLAVALRLDVGRFGEAAEVDSVR